MYSIVRFSLILSVACLLTATGCFFTKHDPGPFAIRVRGTVVDSLSGIPLAGAKIYIEDHPSEDYGERCVWIFHEVVFTDSTGSYSIEIPRDDPSDSFPIGIYASKQGYHFKFFNVEWKSGVQAINFRLVLY